MGRVVDLPTAVDHILQACSDSAGLSPFFFMVGAGVSAPTIPLAPEMVDMCRMEAATRGRFAQPERADPIGLYSHWFQEAYPQPIQRQAFLRSLVESKPITAANFRLAHLLHSSRIARLVFTTNFDDFLSRALSLLGQPHVLCDHPATAQRIDPERDDIQIVHVHGSYWFYDCCNLREEILQRAAHSQAHNMAALLDRTLANRSPIIIGYSGWPGDVVMSALERRLRGPLPYNIYWFYHSRRAIEEAPLFLRHHSQVLFVAPSIEAAPLLDQLPDPEFPSGRRPYQGFPPPSDADTTLRAPARLDAMTVFDALLRAFDCPQPAITSDPLGHFADQLRVSLLQSGPEPAQPDIYFIEDVIDRVLRARAADAERELGLDTQFAELLRCIRQSEYTQALTAAQSIPLSELTAKRRDDLRIGLFAVIQGIPDNPEQQLPACELLLSLRQANSADRDPMTGLALVLKAIALAKLGLTDEEMSTYAAITDFFADSPDVAHLALAAQAILFKAGVLRELGRLSEAISTYDEVISRFATHGTPSIQHILATASFEKARVLGKTNHTDEEVALYDEMVVKFADGPVAQLQALAAKALVYKGIALLGLGRAQEAVACFDEAIARFGAAPEEGIKTELAGAMFFKALALGQLKRPSEQIALFDLVIERYSSSPTARLRDLIARVYLSKGQALQDQSDLQQALSVYSEAASHLDDPDSPHLAPHLARALLNKGVVLSDMGRTDESLATFSNLLQRFDPPLDSSTTVTVAECLFRRAYTQAHAGRTSEAIAAYSALIDRFQQGTEGDIQVLVACSLFNKADALVDLSHEEEASEVRQHLFELFSRSTDPVLLVAVAETQVIEGLFLAQRGMPKQSSHLFSSSIAILSDFEAPPLRLALAIAHAGSGDVETALRTLTIDPSSVSHSHAKEFLQRTQALAALQPPPPRINELISMANTMFPRVQPT